MNKTKEEIEQKIAAREAEARGIIDEFNTKNAAFVAAQKQAQEDFQKYASNAQMKVNQIEGMILQMREDLKDLAAVNAEV